jgi:protease-4
VIFRVDSPGGSYVASDTIWRETVLTKKAGKPVIVSMGNLAGSGGYFVAMAADKIVAQPGTITASIGVLGGKLVTTEMWKKLGLSWDEVHTSDPSTMFTGAQDYTPKQWDKFQQWLDRVYVDFTSKVAEGRKLPKEKVLTIAKGRIWSGQDGKDLGLVDELGGLDVALRLAKEAAKIPAGDEVEVVVYPRKRTLLEALGKKRPESSDNEAWARLAVETTRELAPVVAALRQAGILGPAPSVLSMPPVARPD